MNRRLGGDTSLNAPIRADSDGGGEWQDWLVDDTPTPGIPPRRERGARQPPALLKDAMGVLNDREKRIFEARRLADEPITLEELSTEFGVSRERVRQIEVRAFEKVQKAVKKGARELEKPRAELARRRLTARRIAETTKPRMATSGLSLDRAQLYFSSIA